MNSKQILEINLKKNWRGFEIFLLLIASLEIFMLIYGALSFDLTQLRRKLYYSLYILLLISSVTALLVLHLSMKNERNIRLAVKNVYLFSTVLIFWSAAVSALDIIGNGYPVTYMTIMAALGSVVVLNPIYFLCAVILSGAFMIALFSCVGNVQMSLTFFLNLFIFFLVMIFVEVRNYCAVRQQYILNEKLEELAWIDTLTHAGNRRSLNRRLEQLTQEGKSYSFTLIDVDHFKYINDSCGHREGDSCLIDIANLLSQTFPGDVYRYGGDEFVVISLQGASAVLEKLNEVNKQLKKRPADYTLQISSGIFFNDQGLSEEKVFLFADSALYKAKNSHDPKAVIYRQGQ